MTEIRNEERYRLQISGKASRSSTRVASSWRIRARFAAINALGSMMRRRAGNFFLKMHNMDVGELVFAHPPLLGLFRFCFLLPRIFPPLLLPLLFLVYVYLRLYYTFNYTLYFGTFGSALLLAFPLLLSFLLSDLLLIITTSISNYSFPWR